MSWQLAFRSVYSCVRSTVIREISADNLSNDLRRWRCNERMVWCVRTDDKRCNCICHSSAVFLETAAINVTLRKAKCVLTVIQLWMRSMSPTLHRIINILCKHTLVKKIKGRPNIASWQNSAIFRGLHWKKGFVKRGNINFNLADIYNCNYVYVAEFSGGWVQPHLLVLLQPNSYRGVPEFFFSNLLEDSGNI